MQLQTISSESKFPSEYTDLCSFKAIIIWKSYCQNTKGSPRFYETWCRQLAQKNCLPAIITQAGRNICKITLVKKWNAITPIHRVGIFCFHGIQTTATICASLHSYAHVSTCVEETAHFCRLTSNILVTNFTSDTIKAPLLTRLICQLQWYLCAVLHALAWRLLMNYSFCRGQIKHRGATFLQFTVTVTEVAK